MNGQAIYLYLNAILYFGFAVWCTLSPSATSTNLGYQALSNSGRSEYLVIYGGLQLGLAVIFFILARNASYLRLGIIASVALYAPIVLFRAFTVIQNWPVASLTIATGCLEAALLIAAVGLFYHYNS